MLMPDVAQFDQLLAEVARRGNGTVPVCMPSGGYVDIPADLYNECEAAGFRLDAVLDVLKRWLGSD